LFESESGNKSEHPEKAYRSIFVELLIAFFLSIVVYSCDSGVNNQNIINLIYSRDYDSIAFLGYGGVGLVGPDSIDFADIDNIILTYEYRSNINFQYEFYGYNVTYGVFIFDYLKSLSESTDFRLQIDTIKISNKYLGHYCSNRYYLPVWIDSNRYCVIRNFKMYRYNQN